MKQLPSEKELQDLLEMARIAAEKARETSELATAIAHKYQKRMHEIRLARTQKACEDAHLTKD